MEVPYLKYCLQKLNLYSSSCVRDVIETLLKIHRNIFFNKEVSNYRKIRLLNPTFSSKVWHLEPAQQFMIGCGWILNEDTLNFHADENLTQIISILLEHRFVEPRNSEWKEETKLVKLDASQDEDRRLRAEATVQREKELEEFRKDQMERKILAANVKRQIAEDRRYRDCRRYINSTQKIERQ